MAEDKNVKQQEGLLSSIRKGLANLYGRTYYTPPDGDSELTHLTDRINDSMGKIINDINYSTGLSSISTLYAKAIDYQNDPKVADGFDNLFKDMANDGSVYNVFFNNRSLRLFDAEIDMICKYMPMLEDALGVLCDNVISSDHFSKDFIFISDENVSVENNKELFYNNIKVLKDKYDLLIKFQDIIYNTSKYGERFYYIVPYERAIKKLLDNPENKFVTSHEAMSLTESGILKQTPALKESGDVFVNTINKKEQSLDVEFTFNMSNSLSKEIVAHESAANRLKQIKESALNFNEATTSTVSLVANDKLDASPFYDDTTSNGLIVAGDNRFNTKEDWGLNGCVFKELNRYKIIPVRIEDLILGYAYLENDRYGLDDDFPVSDTTTPVNAMGINVATDLEATKNSAVISDSIVKTVANKLSAAIDTKFIKLNKDLSKEIYTVLKHDLQAGRKNKYNVTFLPPDDVVHCYYKLDPDTYRGISDLYKSMIPAKLFIGLYITNTIGAMTRAQDRRVYYVKQSGIDTNISKILLTTIDQLKRQNFNIRQLESMKNVLNILGRFNDFVIPTDNSGNAPVQFEVMQGQQIDPQTDLMEKLQSMAVNSTDVPFEIVQARQSMDYAIQASMSNSRFLKKIYNRQTIANRFLSSIMTKLYRGEFNNPTAVIKVNLPTPMFLNLTNTNQIIQNANDVAQAAMEAFSDDLDDNAKQIFFNNLKGKMLESYIDMEMIMRVKEATKIEYAANQQDQNADGGEY
jgi:hypothetical protein